MFITRCQKVGPLYTAVGVVRQSTAAALKVESITEHESEWNNAKPYSKIPSPSALGFMRAAMPGGKYYGMGLDKLLSAVKKEYGLISKFPGTFGRDDLVCVFDPKDIEYILRNSGPWPKRKGLETFDYYRYKKRPDIFQNVGGLLSQQGEEWQKTRTTVNPIMMQPRTVDKYAPGIDKITLEFIDYTKKSVENNNPPDDFADKLNKWALESIAFIAVDTRLGIVNSETEHDLILKVREMFQITYDLEIMPSVWKYYKTPKFNRMMALFDEITEILMQHIDGAAARIGSESDTNRDHEMSVFEKLVKIDKRIALIMAYDMLLAGVETTSSTAVSILYLLAKNPDKQDLLREEIRRVMPNKNDPITAKMFNEMRYLRSCIKEGMRILPINGVNMRGLYKDTVIKGYQVPKGTDVLLGHLPLQRSDEFFPKSMEFIPERWLKNLNTSAPGCPVDKPSGESLFAFMPFGFGSRACIGKRFAELEISTLIVRLLSEFELGWSRPDLKYKMKMINHPAEPVKFDYKILSE